MTTTTLASKQFTASTSTALAPSPIGNIARYETTSRTRAGTVARRSAWKTIPSQKSSWPDSKSHHFCELSISSAKYGEINIVVFEDQGSDIWSLASLNPGDQLVVVLCDYTSKSGRFRDTNRVWKIVPLEAVQLARKAQQAATSSLFRQTQPQATQALAGATARALLSSSTHKWKQDLNRPEAYLTF